MNTDTYWTQRAEENFLLRDLPIYAKRNNRNLKQNLENYRELILKRSSENTWSGFNPQLLAEVTEFIIKHPPRVKKRNNQDVVEYKAKPPNMLRMKVDRYGYYSFTEHGSGL